jgi:hypothetical protein
MACPGERFFFREIHVNMRLMERIGSKDARLPLNLGYSRYSGAGSHNPLVPNQELGTQKKVR